jgi:hypothetical protein
LVKTCFLQGFFPLPWSVSGSKDSIPVTFHPQTRSTPSYFGLSAGSLLSAS